MSEELGRRPDYSLKALNRATNEKGDLGVAWANSDGSISIRFNPFVVIPRGSDLIYTLFPLSSK